MSKIQEELLSATKVKATKYEDRQDLLGAIARAISDKISEETFSKLSDEAVEWYDSARVCINKKQEIPEFPDLEPLDEYPPNEENDEEGRETSASPEPSETENVDPPVEAGGQEEPESTATPKTRKVKKKKQPEYNPEVTGEKDKFGIYIGTRSSDIAAAFEKGIRMRDLKEKYGQNYYNLLKDMTKAGHLVEKHEDGTFKLTHKDDIKK